MSVRGSDIVDGTDLGRSPKKVETESKPVGEATMEPKKGGNSAPEGEEEEGLSHAEKMRKGFASGGGPGGAGSSLEDQKKTCCTNLAVSLYCKVWEGAKKALPIKPGSGKKEGFPRSCGDRFETMNPQSFDSGDEGILTETSFDYEDYDELGKESVFQLRPGVFHPGGPGEGPRMKKSPLLQKDPSSEAEEFPDEKGSPEDIDLEKFKNKYVSNKIIPEETEEEIEKENRDQNADGDKAKRRRIEEKEGKRKTEDERREDKEQKRRRRRTQEALQEDEETEEEMDTGPGKRRRRKGADDLKAGSKLDSFARSTSEEVLKKVGNEVRERSRSPRLSVTPSEDRSALADDERSRSGLPEEKPVKGEGLFRLRPADVKLRKEESTESTEPIESLTLEIPTITLGTEDELDDHSLNLSEATIKSMGSHEGLADLPDDEASKPRTKTEIIKSKVKEIGGKVKDIFGKHEDKSKQKSKENLDRHESKELLEKEKEEEQKKKKEDELKRKREEELKKKENELKKKEEEFRKKEEEQKKKEEEKKKKEEEAKRKEEDKRKKEEDKRMKEEEEKKRKEEDVRKKKEDELKKKEVEQNKKEADLQKKEEELKKKTEEQNKLLEEEKKRREKEKEDEEKKRMKGKEEEEERKKAEQNKKKEVLLKQPVIVEEEEEFENEDDKELSSVEPKTDLNDDLHDYYNIDATFNATSTSTIGMLTPQMSLDSEIPSDAPTLQDEMATATPTPPPQPLSPAPTTLDSASGLVGGPGFLRPGTATGATDDEVFLNLESESDIPEEGKQKRKKLMTKKLRNTKNRLKNLTSKAIESLPSMQSIKSRVSDMFSKPGTTTGYQSEQEYEKVEQGPPSREQETFHEYRQRYPDTDAEFFSDSELIESRKSTFRRQQDQLRMIEEQTQFYEEMAATEERVQMLLTPISGPLRPPRRSDYGDVPLKLGTASSDPNISHQPVVPKPRRVPPPRPPPPSVEWSRAPSTTPSCIDSEIPMVEMLLTDGEELGRTDDESHPKRIPPSLFYRNLRKEWREKHLHRLEQMISKSTPALKEPKISGQTIVVNGDIDHYDKPKAPKPTRPPLPYNYNPYDRPRVPRRVSRVASMRTPRNADIDGAYEPINVGGERPPIAPPRRGRSATRSPSGSRSRPPTSPKVRVALDYFQRQEDQATLATAPLYWKPFSWKTGRARSLTELYLQKKSQQQQVDRDKFQQSLRYQLTTQYCVPPLPPRPPLSPRSTNRKLDNEPIYSFINKGSKRPKSPDSIQEPGSLGSDRMKHRPLPPPPVPPRPKCLKEKSSSTEFISRSVSPSGVPVKDVSVSTNDNGHCKMYEKEVQTSLEDLAEVRTVVDCKRPAPVPITAPTPVTPQPMVAKKFDENANFPTNAQPDGATLLPSQPQVPLPKSHQRKPSDEVSNNSAASTRTVGSYYDAEEGDTDLDQEQYDQDTFADVESITNDLSTSTGQFQSLPETPTPTATPVPTLPTTPPPSNQPLYKRRTSSLERLQQRSPGVAQAVSRQTSATRPLAFSGNQPSSPPGNLSRPVRRRSSSSSRIPARPEPEDDSTQEDTDDLLDLARGLQQELRQILERRASRQQSQSRDQDELPVKMSDSESILSSTESYSSFEQGDDPVSGGDAPDLYEGGMLTSPSTARSSVASSRSPSFLHPPSAAHPPLTPNTSDDEDGSSCVDGDTASIASLTLSPPENAEEAAKRKRHRKLYYIAKELTSSEAIFVDILHLLNIEFRAVAEKYITEEVLNDILKHLPQLQMLNENLLEQLKMRLEEWQEKEKIADVLVKIGPFLKQYSLYAKDFDSIKRNYDETSKKYPGFAAAVKEFEATPRCAKLKVEHYMLKPIQRIPQYRLLLEDYLRNLEEDHPDHADTVIALDVVSKVAEHVNNKIKEGDNFAKLYAIQQSLLGHHEIIKPGRVLIKEGELLKLSRREMQPRKFVLCSDCLLYLTLVQSGMFRLNHEIPLTGMRVTVPQQDDFQNEFSVINQTRSFTLAANSFEERDKWLQALNQAIGDNTSRRSTFIGVKDKLETIKNSSRPSSSTSITSSSVLSINLGEEAPVWIQDSRVTMCQSCTSEFTVTFRRHHCRACGKVVCAPCSSNKAPLMYLKYRVARVCDECFDKLKKQMEEKQNKTSNGSTAATGSGSSGDTGFTESEDGSNGKGTGSGSSFNWETILETFHRMPVRASGRKSKSVSKVLTEVCANDLGSTVSGYLHLRKSKHNWKRQWFVIKEKVLYKYKASEDVAALHSMPLLGWKADPLNAPVDGIANSMLLQLVHPGQPSLIFKSETVGSAERWIKAMQEATVLE